jgi:hypothetical protein
LALVVGAGLIGTELLGLIASRFFEVALHIDTDFRAGATEYFAVGAAAVLPFVVFWSTGAAVLGMLAGLRPLFRSRIDSMWKRWAPRWESLDPAVLAASVFLAGVGCFALITARFWAVFAAITLLAQNPQTGGASLMILSPAAHNIHRAHGMYSVGLSFLLGLSAWLWFPRLEKRAADPSTVQLMKWATLTVAFLVVAMAAAPRRILWDTFEVVVFGNQRALVIGTSSQELLLSAPGAGEASRWRVRKDAPGLLRTGTTRELFDLQRP